MLGCSLDKTARKRWPQEKFLLVALTNRMASKPILDGVSLVEVMQGVIGPFATGLQ